MPLSGNFQLLLWRARCFLDEDVEEYNSPADQPAVEDPSYPLAPPGAELVEPLAHRPGMGQTQVESEFFQQFGQAGVGRSNTNGQGFNVNADGFTVLVDRPAHGTCITYLLCADKENLAIFQDVASCAGADG